MRAKIMMTVDLDDVRDVLDILTLDSIGNDKSTEQLINVLIKTFPLLVLKIDSLPLDKMLDTIKNKIYKEKKDSTRIKNLLSDLFENYPNLKDITKNYFLKKGFDVGRSELLFVTNKIFICSLEEKIPLIKI